MSCNLTCEIISTGSRNGNAVLLNGAYLFDCGIGYNRLKPYLKDVRIVFLTHIHTDHFSRRTLHNIHKAHPMTRFVCPRHLLVPLCSEAGVHPASIVPAIPGEPITLTGFGSEQVTIQTFDLEHDVENVGYVVSIQGGELDGTAMYATDTRRIPVSAPGLDLYMIEANHTVSGIQQRIRRKIESGDFCYEERAKVTHMSREEADAWLAANANPYTSHVVYLHTHIEEKGVTAYGPVDSGLHQSFGAPEDQPSSPYAVIEW